MTLSPEQQRQVAEQLKKHQRTAGFKKIILDEAQHVTLKLQIDKDVFGSDIMSSGIYLARFLYQRPNFYKDKVVLDMGCGPGTQGIIMGLYGAKSITFADISPKAVQNTQKNITSFKLINTEIYESDLFLKIPKGKRYEFIVFNHPFFPGNPKSLLEHSMLGGTEIIKKFLKNAPTHMEKNALILMPYFHFAGPENDPLMHAESFGFKVVEKHKMVSDVGLQQGDFSIYILELE